MKTPPARLRLVCAASAAGALVCSGLLLATPAQATSSSYGFEGYTVGNIDGQHGWKLGADVDAGIVANSGAPATFGAKSLRFSNVRPDGGFDEVLSPELSDDAGDSDTDDVSPGTRSNEFVSQFDVASKSGTGADGGSVSVSAIGGISGARMSFVNLNYTTGGLKIQAYDVAPGTDEFVPHDIATVAANVPHTIRTEIVFKDGPSNDVVTVFVDGVKTFTGTSWEDYYRFGTESGTSGKSRAVNRLLFREKNGDGYSRATEGTGMLFDNVSYSTQTAVPPAPTPVVKSASKIKFTRTNPTHPKSTSKFYVYATTTSASGTVAGGTVTVRNSGKHIGTGTVNSAGKVKIHLTKKLAKGKRTLTLTYSGTSTVKGSNVQKTVTVK